MYQYFIAFTYGAGSGNSNKFCDHPIESMEAVRKLEDALAKTEGVPQVIITNYILLSGPES